MNAIDEILKIAGNDTCADVAKKIGVPCHTVAQVLNLKRLVNEEQMVEALPLANCWTLAGLSKDRQESMEAAALVMSPRQFEEACK